MRLIKRGLAVFLAMLLIVPSLPASAEELLKSAELSVADQAGGENKQGQLENNAEKTGTDQDKTSDEKKKPDGDTSLKDTKTPGGDGESGDIKQPGGSGESGDTKQPGGSGESGDTKQPGGSGESGDTKQPEGGEESGDEKQPGEGEESSDTKQPEGGEESGDIKQPVEGNESVETKLPEGTSGSNETSSANQAAVLVEKVISDEAESSGLTAYLETATVSENTILETPSLEDIEIDEILYNTGNHAWSIVTKEAFDLEAGDGFYEEDGSYTINIPEENPFFPYEVQFTCDGEVTNEWFMTPDDSVEIGGHTFYVSAYFDNTVITQMSLNVAGDKVIIWPEEKEFTDEEDGGIMEMSLLPLTEKTLGPIDLTAYTPVELTMVSLDEVFTGADKLQDTDKVAWAYNGIGSEDYVIDGSGSKIDLSYGTGSSMSLEMIVGDADQLNMSNTRYIVTIDKTPSVNWLKPTAYLQDGAGNRTMVSLSGYEFSSHGKGGNNLNTYVSSKEVGASSEIYLGLDINPDVFANYQFSDFEIYDGYWETASEAASGENITSKIYNTDMTQQGAGYLLKQDSMSNGVMGKWVTMVTFDGSGNVTGCMTCHLSWSARGNYVNWYDLRIKKGTSYSVAEDWGDPSSSYVYKDGCYYHTAVLYKGYAANQLYYLKFGYEKNGNYDNASVTAAYVGRYSSIAQASAAGANDIKDQLFGNDGYAADFSQGVYFTIFVGNDGAADQEIYYRQCQTKEGNNENLSRGTSVWFTGVKDGSQANVDCYITLDEDDSYSKNNYVTILVDASTDLTSLAPEFSTSTNAVLYVAGSNTPEVSGVSLHDFSKGAVQYTASSENKKNQENYWVQIVKAVNGVGQLYINSLADPESHTRVANGITYSTREVMLDGYYDYKHDILLTNIGTAAIPALSAELSSNVVELDDYWTLHGNQELLPFTTTQKDPGSSHGELSNLAKLRILPKDGVENGTDVTGTLTIKSAGNTLMVLTLTGTIGDPCITTKEILAAVKYVPYGTMIQNSNKYRWNKVSYELIDGNLPGGMTVKPNGEVYGVPTEAGEFTFTVEMENSSSEFNSSSRRTFTLTVMDNTDANVDGATDPGYDVSQRVQDIYLNTLDGELPVDVRTMVSQGVYGEFIDIFLDGVKLTPGTDYTSESGSTRITIMTQTLAKEVGTHTLGVEFRTGDTDTLKRAAQNYKVEESDGNDSNQDSSGGKKQKKKKKNENVLDSANIVIEENNVGDGNEASVFIAPISGVNAGNMVVPAEEVTVIEYTVEAGDTLWKIAKKFYGSGTFWKKIFEDNADVIKDPNKIYVGQKIKIYLSKGDGTAVAADGRGTYYTVKSGDTLWKIAGKVYGRGRRWRKIYEANKDKIKDPGQIYVGEILFIPE